MKDETDSRLRERTVRRQPAETKAPWILRLVSWSAVMLLLFTLGYFGTGLVLKWVDSKGGPQETTVVSGKEPVLGETPKAPQNAYRVYSLKGNRLSESRVETAGGLMESDMREVLQSLFSLLQTEGVLDPLSAVLHVFRAGDLLYLDVNDACVRSIASLPPEKANLVMTGVVRTIIENFRPVTRVRFLVNGRESTETKPVNLAVAWQLARKP
ncbi:MAG TPA: GerMN domain-containing protein [Synergistales bacterium]|nr:GerMN domain-containing protein [Synergistales bacterium]